MVRYLARLGTMAWGMRNRHARSSNEMTLQGYVEGGFWLVPGWMYEVDVRLFVVMNESQRDLEIRGDLLDIGAYKGRASILLGYLRGDTEALTVCDLFGARASNAYSARENAEYYPGFSVEGFQENYLRFHPELPTVVEGQSAGLAELCAPRTFRFIHVDGSHMYPDVRGDLVISKTLAVPSGSVVAIDDICSPHTPGVWAAAWETIFADQLVPLVVTGSKLYCSWGEGADELSARLVERLEADPRLVTETHPIRDRQLVRVSLVPEAKRKGRDRITRWLPPVAIDLAGKMRKRALGYSRSWRPIGDRGDVPPNLEPHSPRRE